METPQTVSEWASVTAHRRRLDREHRVLDIIEDEAARRDGIDEMSSNVLGMWTYRESDEASLLDDSERRALALAWLGRHLKLALAVAHRIGRVNKRPSGMESDFGWTIDVTDPEGDEITFYVNVPSRLTCELRPTGETRVIPARTEPVMERICPESIFAGIESEVAV